MVPRRVLAAVAVTIPIGLVGLNVMTALRRGSSSQQQAQPQQEAARGGEEDSRRRRRRRGWSSSRRDNSTTRVAALADAGRYSKLVAAEASRARTEASESAADRIERQMALASAAAARLEAAAASVERAVRSASGGRERALGELAACALVDGYRRDREPRNVTACVSPVVQVEGRVRVRLVPKAEKGGARLFASLLSGLRRHPAVELVGSSPRFCADAGFEAYEARCEPDLRKLGEEVAADVSIVAVPATDPKFYETGRILAFSPYRWGGLSRRMAMHPIASLGDALDVPHPDDNPTLFRYALDRERVVFVDETRSPHPHIRRPFLAHFALRTSPPDAFPAPYPLPDLDTPPLAGPRDLDVVCASDALLARLRDRPDRLGAARRVVAADDLAAMRRAKVVVADASELALVFRALASAALVLVDPLPPSHHPLLDRRHLLFYHNATDLLAKLTHALHKPRWARAVALRGYVHVLRHHTPVSWVDYLLRTALLERLAAPRPPQTRADLIIPDAAFYVETGHAVLHRAARHLVAADLSDDDAGPAPSDRDLR